MTRVNELRLFVLAELTRRGPASAHDLAATAVSLPASVLPKMGHRSIHRALRGMHGEGLVETICDTTGSATAPAITYRVTDDGRRHLDMLREQLLRCVQLAPDPFDLALSVTEGMPDDVLAALIDERLRELRLRIDLLKSRLRAARDDPQTRDHYLFIHQLVRLRGELAWHRNLRSALAYQRGERGYLAVRAPR